MSTETTTTRRLAIVPAHNEVEAIADTVAAIKRWAADFDVLVVDDGSTDATAEAAASAGAAVLRLPFNLGIGGAMQSGYLYALERGYEVAVQVDGDGQHDPRHIHDLLERLQGDPGLNMVTGSRFLVSGGERLPLLGHTAHRDPRLRRRDLAHHRQARDRPDLGVPHDRPARDRAVRARLPARLSRGRGDPADARPPPATAARSRSRCARA